MSAQMFTFNKKSEIEKKVFRSGETILQLNKKILHFLGFYKSSPIITHIYSFFTAFVVIFGPAGHFLANNGFNGLDLFTGFSDIGYSATIVISYYWLHCNMTWENQLDFYFEHLARLIDDDTFAKMEKRFLFITRFFLAGFALWTGYTIYLIWFSVKCLKGDCYFIELYFPVEIYSYPWKQIFYTVVYLMNIYIVAGTVCIVFFVSFTADLLINRLVALRGRIQKICELEKKDGRVTFIKKCIIYHQKIIRLWDMYKDHTEASLGFAVFVMIFMIGLLNIKLFNKFETFNLIMCAGYFTGLLVLFGSGEEVFCQCYGMYFDIFHAFPLDGDDETNQLLEVMMLRANQPLIMSIGKFAVSRLYLLGNVLKIAFSLVILFTKNKPHHHRH